MESTFSTKKILIALCLTLFIIIILYIIISRINRRSTNTTISLTPTKNLLSSPILRESKNLEEVPTLDPEQGGGLDTSSTLLKESATNISKIAESLPYSKTFTTTNGVQIEILIPGPEYQDNRWTLSANIYGIDYEVPKGDPMYSNMQLAFRAGAADVFNFIKKNGGDPEKIVFKWGDRLFIDQRAIEWLQ